MVTFKKRYVVIPLILYGGFHYAKHKLKSELLATNYEANISRRYKHFKQDAQYTIDQLLSMLNLDDIDLDLYLQSLSQFKNSQQVLIDGNYIDKLAAWKLFKSKCMEKLFIKIYATCALNLLIHVQMNIIGKYTYLQSVGELNESKIQFTDKQSQAAFLEQAKFIFDHGWKNLNIQNALMQVDEVELNQAITVKDFHKFMHHMRECVEVHNGLSQFKEIILPSPAENMKPSESSVVNINQLNNELYDIIDSKDFCIVLGQLFDISFNTFEEQTSQYFASIKADCVPFAKLLPFIVKECKTMNKPQSVYCQQIQNSSLLNMFTASIYTSFDAFCG